MGVLLRRFLPGLMVGLLVYDVGAAPFEMDVIETEDLRLLYFDPFQTYLVPNVIRNFENSLQFQRELFGWEPSEKTTVILTDLSDYGNAGASASPHNGVSVYIAPASRTLETMPSSERIYMLANHELVHVANMDAANRQDRKWRKFFGGKPQQTDRHPESILYNFLAAPRMSVPRWYLEGAAVFMETWLSGGIGRAQGAYDEMVFRAMVRDEAHFYSNLGIVAEGSSIDFQTGVNAYLYGTRFMSYLAYVYSPEKFIQWLQREENSKRYYSNQFKHVFGRPLEDMWQDWIVFERQFQQDNLESVRKFPITAVRPLSPHPLGSIAKSYVDLDLGVMVGAFRIPGVVAHVGLMSLENGSIKRLVDIKGPMKYRVTSTAYDQRNKTLFYTADNGAYRDLMSVDVKTGHHRMLLKDARIGDLAFNRVDGSIWGLRHLNGYVSLVRIPPPYNAWKLVYSWPYGQVPYEMDISPDGRLLSTSLGEIDGRQSMQILRIRDLLTGKFESISQFDFGKAVPEGFVFSPDGRFLYGSSFYTGVSNIFRYELASKKLEAVSNAETGFFRPIPLADGSLIVFEYTGQGFVPAALDPKPLQDLSAITFLGAEIVKKHPLVKQWNIAGSLSGIHYKDRIVRKGKYRPYRELGYESGYPVIEGYRDYGALGWHFRLQDPAQLHNIDVTTSYSWNNDLASDEKLHVNMEYKALNWHARYWHNVADFYDLFGPTKRSRKGDAFMLGYDRALIFDEPRVLRLKADIAYYTGLDTLPNNQNVSSFNFENILSTRLALNFTDTRKSLGSVDHEKGYRWNLELTADRARDKTIERLRGGFDFGFALPLKHSSVWFYNAAGDAIGSRRNPLANFYFGSYGNNYIDNGEVKRYREFRSFPGYEIDELKGHNFIKSIAEWNLPPKRFRTVGSPGLYLNWARPALFAGVLVTDPGKPYERSRGSAGVQVDLHFTLIHRHPMTLSVGYAVGIGDSDGSQREWLLSLKIL